MRLRLALVLVVVTCTAASVAAVAGPLTHVADLQPTLDAVHVTASAEASAPLAAVPDRVVAPPVSLSSPDATVTYAQAEPASGAATLQPLTQPPAEPPLPILPDDGAFQGATATEPVLLPHVSGIGTTALAPPRHQAREADAPASPADATIGASGTPTTTPQGAGSSTTDSTQSTTARAVAPPSGLGQHARAIAAGGAVALSALVLAGIALYHRVRPATTLDNDTRKSIFDAVCNTPGLGVHAIAAQSNVSYSTATYHLERLVAAGMIVMTPDGNKLCYYKNGGAFTEAERRILPILKNDEATKLLEAILENPGTYRAALAERLGVTATTINWHLKRLREANLVQENRQGRNAYLYANGLALQQSLPNLAQKLATTDVAIAERIVKYLGQTGSAPGGVASS